MKGIFLMVSALGDVSGATIPFNDGSDVSAWLFIKVMCITAVLLIATYAVLLFLKKKKLLPTNHRSSAKALQVIDSCRLSPRTTLYLVRHGAEMILVSESS